MAFLRFDEAGLIAQLAKLPNELRVAFAALCAERQLPSYAWFCANLGSGSPLLLRETLDSIWVDLRGTTRGDNGFDSTLRQCVALISDEEVCSEENAAYAEDAVASVAYTIRARLTGDPQEAAWAARRAYEAVDRFVVSQLSSAIVERDLEGRVASHPLVQAELQRQQADLQDLQAAGANKPIPERVIFSLQDRARRDAELFLNDANRQ